MVMYNYPENIPKLNSIIMDLYKVKRVNSLIYVTKEAYIPINNK